MYWLNLVLLKCTVNMQIQIVMLFLSMSSAVLMQQLRVNILLLQNGFNVSPVFPLRCGLNIQNILTLSLTK